MDPPGSVVTRPLKIVPYNAAQNLELHGPARPKSQALESTHLDHPRGSVRKTRRACAACRDKKTRCSGGHRCLRCSKLDQACHYDDTLLLSTSNAEIRPDDALNAATSSINARTPDAADPSRRKPSTSNAARFFHAGDAHVPASVDTPDEPLQEDQYGHFHGGASGFAFLQFARQRLANLPTTSLQFLDYPIAASGTLPPVLPPKAIADDLVEAFFDFGLATTRFVHQPSFTWTYEKLYGDGNLTDQNQGEMALICMVLAIGAHYSAVTNAFSGFSASVRYYDIAKNELSKETSKITFSLLQAKLLVIHFLINHSRMHEAWTNFGIVVRQAQALRLHRRAMHDGNINLIHHEFRKRLFWSIYIYDRQLSSIFGRPCALHDMDIDQEEFVLANDDDITAARCLVTQPGSFCSASAMLHYTRLASILGEILSHLHGPIGRSRGVAQLQEKAMGIEQSLSHWQANLPAYLDYTSLPPSAMSVITQRQMCTLKLTFLFAELLLYRPFIVFSMRRSHGDSSIMNAWTKHSYDNSIKSATAIVDECRALFGQGLLSGVFGLFIHIQFAAIGTLYWYLLRWQHAPHVRQLADDAMTDLESGTAGDPVSQHYIDVLNELRATFEGQGDTTIDQMAAPFDDADFQGHMDDADDPWAALLFEFPLATNGELFG